VVAKLKFRVRSHIVVTSLNSICNLQPLNKLCFVASGGSLKNHLVMLLPLVVMFRNIES
jgi:hypothetical protein